MFRIAAHRGGNSWPCILEAVKKGYDYAELDVHLSKDGELIVQYSPIVEIFGNNILIRDLVFGNLSRKEKNGLILLRDILGFAQDKIGIVIDIKKGPDFYPEIGKKIAKLIQDTNSYPWVWVISFDHQSLVEAKKYDSNVQVAPMYVARIHDEEKYWKSIFADGIEICNDYLTYGSVQLAHKNKLKVLGWCTENMDELRRLVDFGIDIITIEQEDRYYNFIRSLERNIG